MWAQGLDPTTDLVPLQDEAIPPDGPVELFTSMIHFDIDPDNGKYSKTNLLRI
jgi:hypothetical protein